MRQTFDLPPVVKTYSALHPAERPTCAERDAQGNLTPEYLKWAAAAARTGLTMFKGVMSIYPSIHTDNEGGDFGLESDAGFVAIHRCARPRFATAEAARSRLLYDAGQILAELARPMLSQDPPIPPLSGTKALSAPF